MMFFFAKMHLSNIFRPIFGGSLGWGLYGILSPPSSRRWCFWKEPSNGERSDHPEVAVVGCFCESFWLQKEVVLMMISWWNHWWIDENSFNVLVLIGHNPCTKTLPETNRNSKRTRKIGSRKPFRPPIFIRSFGGLKHSSDIRLRMHPSVDQFLLDFPLGKHEDTGRGVDPSQ